MNPADYSLTVRILENLGSSGLLILVIWKLVDRWAGQFLNVQKEQVGAMTKQACAMTELATAVHESLNDQRELLLAVRVLATKVDEQKAWLKELSETLSQRRIGA